MLGRDMFAVAFGLGEAKSRQCVSDALQFLHNDVVLTSPAWGTVARGIEQNAAVLHRFFADFPDYSVELAGHVADANHLLCWGTVRMTMAPGAYGLRPNGIKIQVPAFLRFTFKDGLIASEYFMVDLAAICSQSGVSTDAVMDFLTKHRGAAKVAEAG